MIWTKSSLCKDFDCAEVSRIGDGGALIRNSQRPGEVIALSGEEWDAFVAGVKAGDFDELSATPVTATVDHGDTPEPA